MTPNVRWFIAYVAVLIAAVVSVAVIVSEAQDINAKTVKVVTDNQLAACFSGNPLRYAVHLAIDAATKNPASSDKYRDKFAFALKQMDQTPFVNPVTGKKACRVAYGVPPLDPSKLKK